MKVHAMFKPISLALLAFLASTVSAQETKPGEMRDKPVAKEELAPDAYQAFTTPLEARVTLNALNQRPSPPVSFGTGLNHFYHSNVYNHQHGGFEPRALRPKYRAEADAWDVVELNDRLALNVREGFYDGARVRVYQAIDGKLVKIRDTKIVPGGHHATGWFENRGYQITTSKGKTNFRIALDSSFLPRRQYWFCVKAVDKFRQNSEPSNVVELQTDTAKGQQQPEDYAPWPRFDDQNPNKPAPPSAPKNLRATVEGDVARFEWEPVEAEQLHGYTLFVASVPPEQIKGFRLELADRQPCPDRIIQRGDIVFVDHETRTFTPDLLSPYVGWPAMRQIHQPFDAWMLGHFRCWSDGSDYPAKWELVDHPKPVPAEFVAHGKTCLKWQVAGNELTGFQLGPNGGVAKENDYYTPFEPGEYRVEAWIRGSGKAAIAFAGIHANPGTPLPFNQRVPAANPHAIAPVELPLTEQWQHATGTFTVKSVPPGGLGNILFTFQGPGTVYVDDLRIYRANAAPYGELHETFVKSMRASGTRFMRTHEMIRTKLGYTLDEATLPASGSTFSMSGYRSSPTTLKTLLDSIRSAGKSARLQVEMCLADEEWLGLAEWLFAPYDPAKGDTPTKKPWAYRRWVLGQQKPWIEEFPEFALEISNETWNQTFEPYDWDWGRHVMVDGADGRTYSYGATYGLFQEHVISLLRSSPYWNERIAKKMSFPLCAWTAAPSFGAEAARLSPSSTEVGYANYLAIDGLGDPKEMNDFKRFYMMQWAISGVRPQVEKTMGFERALRSEGVEVTSGCYEYGICYTAPAPAGVGNAEQQFGRATPAAVAVLDASLMSLSLGYQDLTYFTFGPSLGIWGSHTEERLGGHAYPFFKALALYNQYGAGQLLATESVIAPKWDFPAYEALDNTAKVKRSALPQAPLVSVYASANGDRMTVFLISRKLDNFPVTGDDGFNQATVKLPFAKAKKITLHKLAGDPRTDDRYEDLHKVETITLDPKAFKGTLAVNAATGADARGLPPASIFCYVFEGTDAAKPSLPPVARFEIPDTIVAGEPATLRGTAGDNVTYAWDCGPAGKSAERNPAVTFPEAVMADLSLTVSNPQGQADTLTRNRYLVGVRFGGEIWRPWVMSPWQETGGSRGRLATDGALVVSGAMPINAQGLYSLLRSAPRLRQNYAIEATLQKVEGQGNDPRVLGGLTLVSNLRAGLGFSEFDYEGLTTHASLLLSPDGALRRLKGLGDQLEELLPPGAVKFPAKLRIVVKANQATAAVETAGVWKEVATFALPDDIGLMPALAVGSPGANTTTMTVSAVKDQIMEKTNSEQPKMEMNDMKNYWRSSQKDAVPEWISHAPDVVGDNGWPRHGFMSDYADAPDVEKWIAFDLGAERAINAVALYPLFPLHEGGCKEQWRGGGLYFPRAFRVEVADAPDFARAQVVAEWRDEVERRETEFDDAGRFLGWHEDVPIEDPVRIDFKPVNARHVRIVATRLGGYYGVLQLNDNKPKRYALALPETEIYSGSDNFARQASVRVSDAATEAPRCAPEYINDGRRTPLPPAALFRKEFSLDENPVCAVLEATACGVYHARIDGQPVSEDRFSPEWTNYAVRLLVQSYDVTERMHKGAHALAVAVGDGWMFSPMSGGLEAKNPYGCRHQFMARLTLTYADGRRESICTDDSWHSTNEGPWRRTDLYIGEIFDRHMTMPGWDKTGFDESRWLPVHAGSIGDQVFAPQTHPGIRTMEEIPCSSVTERKPGVYLLDFGANLLGVCRLRLRGRAGEKIRLQYVQELNPDGSPHTFSLNSTMQRDFVIPDSDEFFAYEPLFTIHCFQYVEISGVAEAPKPEDATALYIHSAAEARGRFVCSNEVLNRLLDACDRTIRANLLSVFTDCPGRERYGWPTSEAGYSGALYQRSVENLFEKWLVDFEDAFHVCDPKSGAGFYPIYAPAMPNQLGPRKCGDWFSFGWCDSPLHLTWHMWLHHADRRFMEDRFSKIMSLMSTLERLLPADLDEPPRVHTFFGDWLDANTLHDPLWTDSGYLADPSRQANFGVDKQFFAYAFLAHDFDLASRIASILGQGEKARAWHEQLAMLKTYFVRHFFDKTGKAKSHTQGAYALALYFDLLPEDRIESVLSWLDNALQIAGHRLATGFVTTPMLLHALSRYGRHETACRLVLSDQCPGYGYMIKMGATTIWERWDHDVWLNKAYMNDPAHRDFTTLADWVWQRVVGLQSDPAAPGFERVIIAPNVDGPITFVSATHESARGPIAVEWSVKNGLFAIQCDLPIGVTGTFIPPRAFRSVESLKLVPGENRWEARNE